MYKNGINYNSWHCHALLHASLLHWQEFESIKSEFSSHLKLIFFIIYLTGKKFNQVCKLPTEIPPPDWFHECQSVHHTLQPGVEQTSCTIWELLPSLVLPRSHSYYNLHPTCPHTFNQHSLDKHPEPEAGPSGRCCPSASSTRSEPAKTWDVLLLHNSFNLYCYSWNRTCHSSCWVFYLIILQFRVFIIGFIL